MQHMEGKQNKNKFWRKNKPNQNKNQSRNDKILSKYSRDTLNIDVRALGLTKHTEEILIASKKIKIKDLVISTQKDMYRIQGFNKEIFAEISKKLDMFKASFAEDSLPKMNVTLEVKKQEEKPKQEKSEWGKIYRGNKEGLTRFKKIFIQPEYDEISYFKEGLSCVSKDGKYGYINEKNEIVIDAEYDMAFGFSEGYAVVEKDGKMGYINKEGEEVIPLEFDAATAFINGEAKVKQDGRWGTINQDKKIVWII